MNNITTIDGFYRAPFAQGAPRRLQFDLGQTLAAMIERANLPVDFAEFGSVFVGGQQIDRAIWRLVRPKAGHDVTFHYFPLRGGGDESGGKKAVLGVVLAVATILTAGAVAAFGVPALGIAAGSFQATLLAGGISVDGPSALEALG